LTLVRSDGRVTVDSDADAARMENHATRPELKKALAGAPGWSIRRSGTLGIPFLYVASPCRGGAVRLALPYAQVEDQVAQIRAKILTSTALAFLPAILVAALLARWISRHFATIMAHAGELAGGNFRARLPVTGGNEFGQLAHAQRRRRQPATDGGAVAARAQRTGAAGTHPQGLRHQRLA
jgi:two-component system phosphate regulon sensor histidine kinase PhoR